MNYLRKIGLLLFFTTLLLTACRKDEEMSGFFPPGPSIPEVIVNGSFYGTVTDEDNLPIENTLITFGTNTILTDKNGFFSFRDIDINERGSLLTAEKEGYFYNAKFIRSKLNNRNFTSIKLIKKTLTGTFPTNTGSTVLIGDRATIQFSANSIEQENGTPYTGDVNVYATWLNPLANDLTQRMPGDLRAINTDNDLQQLTTYGMIGVELEGEGGEALNIRSGQTAIIELFVPGELIANAPATIPLWHFDEITGFWMEEGEADLQGDKYVGTVGHFSFWNIDIPKDFITIEGTIVDRDGQTLENLLVIITDLSNGVTGSGWTDEDGVFAGAVPANENLTITVQNSCGDEIYNASIGPFSEDAIIPTFAVSEDESFTTLSGTLIDCDNNPITNGYLKVDFGDRFEIIPAESDGTFNGTISACDATSFDLTGFDVGNVKQSNTVTITIDSPVIDLANIFVCEDLSQFIIFNYRGEEILDPTPFALIAPGLPLGQGVIDTIVMQFDDPNSTTLMNMNVLVDGPGTYSGSDISLFPSGEPSNYRCSNMECDVTFEITTLEMEGGFIIGTYSGTLEPTTGGGPPAEISGSFKAILL